MSGWRRILIVLLLMMFCMGLFILVYPVISGKYVDQSMKDDAQSFIDLNTPEYNMQSEPENYKELWVAMIEYNNRIRNEKQAGLCDPWSYEQSSFDLSEYGLENEIFGVLKIPRLELEMPIYLGASELNLASGAAHLSQTSLPIGGDNTNCVIAGHRGCGGASYFRYINQLESGDEILLTNLWETMRYTVTETQIISPDQVEAIHIQEGRELLTLLTCHPYASGGRQRMLVICERVYEEQ